MRNCGSPTPNKTTIRDQSRSFTARPSNAANTAVATHASFMSQYFLPYDKKERHTKGGSGGGVA